MLFWKCKFWLIWFFSSKFPLFNLLKLHALCMASYNNDIFKLFLKALDIVSSKIGHLLNVPDQPVSILCLKLLNIFFLYWKEVKCYVLIICKNSPRMLALEFKKSNFHDVIFQLTINVSLMCVSVLLNANPVLFILGSYLFKVQASAADAMGKALI